MNVSILHEIKGRMRFKVKQDRMTIKQADLIEAWFEKQKNIEKVVVHERTCCVVVYYSGKREDLISQIKNFTFELANKTITLPQNSSRQLNRDFQEKLVGKVVSRAVCKLFLPSPLRVARVIYQMIPFIKRGFGCLLRRELKVDLLDAISIGISACKKDFSTAGAVMFLLEIGELLEDWTRKKSVQDLAKCMSINVDRVWLKTEESEVLTPISQIQAGDRLVLRAGSMIPMDGILISGEMTVNQASLTGESIPVAKHEGFAVYAGTVVEEGEGIIEVKKASGQSRYEQIIKMIENSEKMKSESENKASNLADKLVPYTFAGSILSYVLTRNVSRALSVLMVDFSCALKLAMPLAVLSAMREAGKEHITVKGGKFLETVAEADVIVFDKTGTLTHACPKVEKIITFGDNDEDEMLRLAACLEEHFPHSMANAVVKAAKDKGLTHDEFHTKVEYIVAHGIASTVDNQQVLIGSRHFIFEDENCYIPENEQQKFDLLPDEYSHLYLAKDKKLIAVICISDPLRSEAVDVIKELKNLGIKKTVMLTGDNYKTAKAIADKLMIDDFKAEVLPSDKAEYIAELKKSGHKVIMLGDGVNDSPALSEADAGIAVHDGADIAREIADITISAESLYELVKLRKISMALIKRIKQNYRFVIGFNGGLIGLGVLGFIQPATSATLHNLSTLAISLNSMTKLDK